MNINEIIDDIAGFSDLKKEEKLEALVDAGVKYSEAKAYVESNSTGGHRINYPELVRIFRKYDDKDKKKAIAEVVAAGLCTQATAGHMWSARNFAKAWSAYEAE